jgi:hypothetical protein
MSDHNRFLPHLKQIRAAALELPDAELWPSEDYIVELKGSTSSHLITFKRTAYHSKTRGKTYKWLYEGKMWVS